MKEATIILKSGKCAWGKCFACGWGRLDYGKPNLHKLKKDIDDFFKKLGKIERLKVFTSGSFLDENQFPETIRLYLAKKVKEHGIRDLVIESLPQFINEKTVKPLLKYVKNLYIGIGLEAADNEILKKYQKPFTVEEWIEATKKIHELGAKVRTYIMVNLPWVKDHKKLLKKSFDLARKYSDEIVIINTFPHSKSPLFHMWINGKWKPMDEEEFFSLVKPYMKYKNVEVDFNNFAFEPKFPKELKKPLKGVGKEYLLHPYYDVWQDFFIRFYKKPKDKEFLLFIPCTYTKPYYKSKLHREILNIIPKNVHIVVVSSPGVIPYEYVDRYPFDSYDWEEWKETEEIKKLYIKVTTKRVENYLRKHKYKKYFIFMKPNSETYKSIMKASKKLGIEIIDCLKKETWEKIKDKKNPLLYATKDLEECMKKFIIDKKVK